MSADGLDLLKKLLTLDHRKRINVNEALKHEYFKDLHSEENEVSNLITSPLHRK